MELEEWKPRTALGMQVKNRTITDIDAILKGSTPILEEQIVDSLLELDNELLLIGQSRGKFGGGQRRIFKQTQKKTREGNKPQFTTLAVVGDKNGHVGVGIGKSKETVPAREKALRNAKKNLFLIRRGSGAWEGRSPEPHSIPFSVEGKVGSVIVRLMPAPKGTGLIVEKEMAKVLRLAGIKDVWSKTFGQTKNKINLISATVKALKQLGEIKIQEKHNQELNMVEGSKEEAKDEVLAMPEKAGAKK